MTNRRAVQQVEPVVVAPKDRAGFGFRRYRPGVTRGCVNCKVLLPLDAVSYPILCDSCMVTRRAEGDK